MPKIIPIRNRRVEEMRNLPTPKEIWSKVKDIYSLDEDKIDTILKHVADSRSAVEEILLGKDPRLLLIVGPCSIHDNKAAIEYANNLKELSDRVKDRIFIVMRTYFEKPRTVDGWKGLIDDPDLDGSSNVDKGIVEALSVLIEINGLGLPAGTEALEVITPQYFMDLVSWTSIGARTVESQIHRKLASGLSVAVGFKNNTSGNIQVAIDAVKAASKPSSFLGIDDEGRASVIKTTGNRLGHVILRGGMKDGSYYPNYSSTHIQETGNKLEKENLISKIIVDCSHGNSGKKHENQRLVFFDVLAQKVRANLRGEVTGERDYIAGMMLESFIFEGNQKFVPGKTDPSKLKYGVSITDACIGWEETEELILEAYSKMGDVLNRP